MGRHLEVCDNQIAQKELPNREGGRLLPTLVTR